ncbi:MAG: hypothetical protein HQL87_13970 [Magnetococcales bacterium]|nr:hypothetical protein [Magnetococcales bacterium]
MIMTLLALSLAAPVAQAEDENSPEELKKDAQAHRAFAEWHRQAAQCLESGQSHEVCEEILKQACKGKASGPHCGMKHEHAH